MPRNGESRGAGGRTRLSEGVQAGSSNAFKNTQSPARPQALIRLAPIWSDDRTFCGWLTVGEAAALALANMGGRS